MIYENWRDLKPLTAPVPVGTKVVCIGGLNFNEGDILTVQGESQKSNPDNRPHLDCANEKGLVTDKCIDYIALLPTQSTMTEQERWQFGGIDLDACECVMHEGRRYPWVDVDGNNRRVLLFVVSGYAICVADGIELKSALSHCNDKLISWKLTSITTVPKKTQPTTRPWTQDEMLELLRKGGVEIQKKSGEWISGALYYIDKSSELCIDADNFDQCIAYRSQDTNWESRPLTKVVE